MSREVRLLQNKWQSGTGWPKRLEWIEIDGLRGWAGQRVDFSFPITALVGENGVGKSTVLQSLASSYAGKNFASDFFPSTIWEEVRAASIRVSIREGQDIPSVVTSVRKATDRWRGNPKRRERPVAYVDLRRVQPISARVGYRRLARPQLSEAIANPFDSSTLRRLSNVMGRNYDLAKLSTTNMDANRRIPVLTHEGASFSGFHQGAGETTMADLINAPSPKYAMLLIDEVETSLHPRAQRRLIRDLAAQCRSLELQIVLTTHSPYVLEELPPEARIYIMEGDGGKQIISGVSPEFAMTKMDEENHPEVDVFVEDNHASILLREILVEVDITSVPRIQMIPFGAASVGRALGQMVEGQRFPRPTLVFLDGDQEPSVGCLSLPGGDAPERVVFEDLKARNWEDVPARLGRPPSSVIDSCSSAMVLANHHEWINAAANELVLGGDVLWQALCATWAANCLDKASDGCDIADTIADALTPG